jgi:hypothetical protein
MHQITLLKELKSSVDAAKINLRKASPGVRLDEERVFEAAGSLACHQRNLASFEACRGMNFALLET